MCLRVVASQLRARHGREPTIDEVQELLADTCAVYAEHVAALAAEISRGHVRSKPPSPAQIDGKNDNPHDL